MSELWDKVKEAASNMLHKAQETGKETNTTSGKTSRIDYRAGLRNWFHVQKRLPPKIHTLPPDYQAMADKFNNLVMVRAHQPKTQQKSPTLATPTFHHGHNRC